MTVADDARLEVLRWASSTHKTYGAAAAHLRYTPKYFYHITAGRHVTRRMVLRCMDLGFQPSPAVLAWARETP